MKNAGEIRRQEQPQAATTTTATTTPITTTGNTCALPKQKTEQGVEARKMATFAEKRREEEESQKSCGGKKAGKTEFLAAAAVSAEGTEDGKMLAKLLLKGHQKVLQMCVAKCLKCQPKLCGVSVVYVLSMCVYVCVCVCVLDRTKLYFCYSQTAQQSDNLHKVKVSCNKGNEREATT